MTANGYRFYFGDENVLESVVLIIQSCDYTKTHQNVHFKRMDFFGM